MMGKSATKTKSIAFGENPKEVLAIADVISKVLGGTEARKPASSAAKLVWKTLVAQKLAREPYQQFFELSSALVAKRRDVKTVTPSGAFEYRTYDLFIAALVVINSGECGSDSPACKSTKEKLENAVDAYGFLLHTYSVCMSKRSGGISSLTIRAADGLILGGMDPAPASGGSSCESQHDMLMEIIRQLNDLIEDYKHYCGG